jgi:hypothetical protein
MRIPFTTEAFLSVFERYNLAIGPAPVVAVLLGLAALALAIRGGPRASRAVLAILALLWGFVGGAYHLVFFRPVNPAAAAFGAAFLAQAALYALAAARGGVAFGLRPYGRHALALVFAAYALVAYPLLGRLAGHVYPRAPLFGVAPCPTVVFTFALLLLADRVGPTLFAIPFLWSLVGVSAAVQLGMGEDYGLAVAGVAGTALLVRALRRPDAARARGSAARGGGAAAVTPR